MEVKGDSGEISDGNEEQVINMERKGRPCYKVAKNLVDSCSTVL